MTTNTQPQRPADLPVGFTRAEYTFKPRLIIAAEGNPKEGKTHFALTMPGPIAYLNLDKMSREDVLEKFSQKEVYDKDYHVPPDADQPQYVQAVNDLASDLKKLAAATTVRSIVVDTGSDLYRYVQFAKFGKATSIPPFRYGEINLWFQNNITAPYFGSDKNMLVVYKLKKEYKQVGEKDMWTGDYERSGFRDSNFDSQINIRLERTALPEAHFRAVVLNSSQNAALLGKTFVSNPYIQEPSFNDLTGDAEVDDILFGAHKCSFPFVAQAVFPHTNVLEWL
jgi:hypothetical protein